MGYRYFTDVCQSYFCRYGGVVVAFLAMLPSFQHSDKPTEYFLQSLHDLVNIGLDVRDLFVSLKVKDEISVTFSFKISSSFSGLNVSFTMLKTMVIYIFTTHIKVNFSL